MGETGEQLPEPIRELRETLSRVRRLHETGMAGFAIESARYEAEAQPHNQKFIEAVMKTIPITTIGGENDVIQVGCKNPADIIPSLSFLTVLGLDDYQHGQMGVSIGEKVSSSNKKLTEVLWIPLGIKDNPLYLKRLFVPTGQWNEKRDKFLEKTSGPTGETEFSELHLPLKGVYGIKKSDILLLSGKYRSVLMGTYDIQDPVTNSSRTLEKPGIKISRAVGFYEAEERFIRSADFVEFNVMYHLEILAGAYGFTERLDRLKAIREKALPPSPETTVFGLPNYRAITEEPN